MSLPKRLSRPVLVALLVTASVVAGGAGASVAQARVEIGIGQQTPQMFSSPAWHALKAPNVRYIAPWDVIDDPAQLALLDRWMAAADANGANVMLGFQHSLRSARLARVLPTAGQYASAFRRLHARYPQVHDWVPWNETNNPAALTGRNPARAAAFYDAVVNACPGCNVVAGDVLDLPNMAAWIKRFQQNARHRPTIWGLHNYHDANSFISQSTKLMLRLTRGQLWFTETGGVIKMRVTQNGRLQTRNYGMAHAVKATRYALDLARLSGRIRRIYVYHWLAPSRFTTWDSALTDPHMRPRPTYRALASWLVQARRTRLAK